MLTLVPKAPNVERIPVIDEYGEICRQIDALKPAFARQKVLRVLIDMWSEAAEADQPALFTGSKYDLQVSPRENQTKIASIRRVSKLLGVSRFMSICSITLKAVRENVTQAQFDSLVVTERTGSRSVKAVAKAPEADARQAA